MDGLHPLVQHSLQRERKRMRTQRGRGRLANFNDGEFVLVAREDFNERQNLCLHWFGFRRFTKDLSDFVFVVKDLRSG